MRKEEGDAARDGLTETESGVSHKVSQNFGSDWRCGGNVDKVLGEAK